MNSTTKSAFVLAFVVSAFLLLAFGDGTGTDIMTGNGMMGNGSMAGLAWMWFPVLILIALGVALFWGVFERK